MGPAVMVGITVEVDQGVADGARLRVGVNVLVAMAGFVTTNTVRVAVGSMVGVAVRVTCRSAAVGTLVG